MSDPSTILVVDDTPSNRILVAKILQMNDFQVLEAQDVAEAVRVSQAYRGTIHLLIADLVLPTSNGIELARILRPLHPDMKVLYISGYHADVNVQFEVWDKKADFIAKPFTPNSLLRKIQSLLGSSSSVEERAQ